MPCASRYDEPAALWTAPRLPVAACPTVLLYRWKGVGMEQAEVWARWALVVALVQVAVDMAGLLR